MNTNINSTGTRLRRRGLIALAALGAVGLTAGSVAAEIDVPDNWPPAIQQEVQQAEAFCTDLVAAEAAGYNVIVGAGLIVGTNFDDLILGSFLPDRIDALDGDDIVCAGGGNDRVRAGNGDDIVLGEGGNDRLRGNPGDDILIGGPGADLCLGDAGFDWIDC